MTRDEAIKYLVGLQDSVSTEYACSRNEVEANKANLRAALGALGVDSSAIPANAGGGSFG